MKMLIWVLCLLMQTELNAAPLQEDIATTYTLRLISLEVDEATSVTFGHFDFRLNTDRDVQILGGSVSNVVDGRLTLTSYDHSFWRYSVEDKKWTMIPFYDSFLPLYTEKIEPYRLYDLFASIEVPEKDWNTSCTLRLKGLESTPFVLSRSKMQRGNTVAKISKALERESLETLKVTIERATGK